MRTIDLHEFIQKRTIYQERSNFIKNEYRDKQSELDKNFAFETNIYDIGDEIPIDIFNNMCIETIDYYKSSKLFEDCTPCCIYSGLNDSGEVVKVDLHMVDYFLKERAQLEEQKRYESLQLLNSNIV